MSETTDGSSAAIDVRLSRISLVATALWMPLTTALVAHLELLENTVVLVILMICWIGSALVFLYPYALKVDEEEVVGTWTWGRIKRWPRESLELDPAWSLPGSAFGARQVKSNGKLVFFVWSLMSHSTLALAALGKKTVEGVS
jgi:hypothetical protein